MFQIFRFIFGCYLTIHFIQLIPYAEELFGNKMLFDHHLNPTNGILPDLLDYIDVHTFLTFLVVYSVLFMLGWYHQICALFLWIGWFTLLNRNNLIHNPGIPYVGWLLCACIVIRKQVPPRIMWLAWFLMGLGYTASGLHKLQCQSWIDGNALQFILESPLARDTILRTFVLSLPPIILKMSTWVSLFLEISFLPLGMFYYTRCFYWSLYVMFHLTILLLINFTDLTLGMLAIHLFTFDPKWIPKRKNA